MYIKIKCTEANKNDVERNEMDVDKDGHRKNKTVEHRLVTENK